MSNSTVLFYKLNKVDCTNGANLVAFAAACAFIIVNLCAEAVNCYSACFAFFYALHAADAACRAFLAGECAFIMVFAKNSRFDFFKGHHFDESLRAGLYAHFASFAENRVDSCDAVAHADCVILTNFNAVTETDAAVDAVFGSAKNLRSHSAALYALIFELC